MARKTKEEKMQDEINELHAQIKSKDEVATHQMRKIDSLYETLKIREQTIQNLQENINRINHKFEEEQSEQVQTIRFSTNLMIAAFNKIKCPITRREAFKQFVAIVVDGDRKDLEQFSKEAANTINARSESIDNTSLFLNRVVNNQISYLK